MPSVIELAAQYRAELLAKDALAMGRLVKAYGRAFEALSDKLELLLVQIGDKIPTTGQIARMERYKSLMAQAAMQLRDLEALTRAEMEAAARLGIDLGSRHARGLIVSTMGGDPALAGAFNVLPNEAIRQLLGFLSPDGELYKRLGYLSEKYVSDLAEAMINGIALGYNPRKTAAIMRKIIGGGLTDSLRIVRTAQLWSYREANRATYIANSDVVEEWMWYAELDERVCASCVAMHGKTFPLDEPLNDHHNGRCAMLPVVKGLPPVSDQTGEAWFNEQDEATQRKLLGPGKYEAWKNGEFKFGDLSAVRDDPVYGAMRVEATLGKLVGSAPAADGAVGKVDTFIPAKTYDEAVQRLNAYYDGKYYLTARGQQLAGVNFTGVELDKLNSMLRGFEDVATRYNVTFSNMGYQYKRANSYGVCRYMGSKLDRLSIEIQKNFLRRTSEEINSFRGIFNQSLRNRIEMTLEHIADPIRKNILEHNQRQLGKLQQIKRWAIFMEKGVDPIEAVMRHETYHAVYFHNQLDDIFSAAIKRNSANSGWLSVSEYAGTNMSELFAEAASAIDYGIEIPEEIRLSVLETLAEAAR